MPAPAAPRPTPQPLDDDLQVELLFIHAGTPESSLAQAWLQHMLDGARLHVARFQRSEEHTSELQSPCNLVCRLLLEKKKKKTQLLAPRTQTAPYAMVHTQRHSYMAPQVQDQR